MSNGNHFNKQAKEFGLKFYFTGVQSSISLVFHVSVGIFQRGIHVEVRVMSVIKTILHSMV